ncbi:Hypothetical predicted protein [Marmota monax]|uniref:Olduvai domain-containing protein n=1 Tax=Marmota monax TaxID=9995 RepID=A0A5E4D878_MARMO|nr:Hypothetical predicted protein [Marmota monax]
MYETLGQNETKTKWRPPVSVPDESSTESTASCHTWKSSGTPVHSQLSHMEVQWNPCPQPAVTHGSPVEPPSVDNEEEEGTCKCEEYPELIKSVLEEELQCEEGGVAEELRRGASLGKSDRLFQAQAQELTYLRQKIQEGRSVCYLFAQHVKNAVRPFESVLGSTGVTSYDGQRLCEQLTQGSKLPESLAAGPPLVPGYRL